jgi:hypothetical protein
MWWRGTASITVPASNTAVGHMVLEAALRDLGRTEGMEALVDQWLPPMIAPARQDDPALMSRLRPTGAADITEA